MQDVKWIKISTGIFDNRKIKQIESMPDGDALIVIWLKLLILAGEVNENGYIYLTKDIPYTDQLMAVQFGRPIATIQLALSVFERFQMIEIINNIIRVSNWEKYQNLESMDRIREQNRLRKQRQREQARLTACDTDVTSRDSHVTVTQENKNKNKNKEYKEKSIEKKSAARFCPPSFDEVNAYCEERKNGIDAQHFLDYYEANGWKVGKNQMKDWKAAVRTWEKNGIRNSSAAKPAESPKKTVSAQAYEQRDYTADQLSGLADSALLEAREKKGA